MRYDEIITKEDARLRERRRKLFGDEQADKLKENRFGIALSGGGIRSATINLGLLKTLNRFGILKKVTTSQRFRAVATQEPISRQP